MRYGRLTLGSGKSAPAIAFHPRLTVIAGVGPLERDCLIGELIGALSGTRRGTALELTDDDGRTLVVDRTNDHGSDTVKTPDGDVLTSSFTSEKGRVDLLATIGLDVDSVRRKSRMTASDIAAASRGDAIVARLAELDQKKLWSAADQLRMSDAFMKTEANLVGADVEDAEIIEQIEARHQQFEGAQARHEFVRHHAMFTGGGCAVGAVPVLIMTMPKEHVQMIGRMTALAMIAIAAVFTVLAVITRRRMEAARAAETEALTNAGADSYIGFHIRRMNQLLEGQQNRERITRAAKEHRIAQAAWRELVGEVTLDWALGNSERIKAAAKRLRERGDLGPEATAALREVDPTELAQAFVSRVAELRHSGSSGQSLPLLLDEPLRGVDLSVKQWMLELIVKSAGSPQIVLLTDDADVLAWARKHASAGSCSLIAPDEASDRDTQLVA
jgi:hypothetical protein